MEEKTVTIDKETYELPKPFSVIATQNPSDLSGTSLLPESQLDRFTISFSLDELNQDERILLLKHKNNFQNIKSNFSLNNVKKIDEITLKDDVIVYIDIYPNSLKKIIHQFTFLPEVSNKSLIFQKQFG